MARPDWPSSRPEPVAAPLVGFKRHLRAETVPGEAVYVISARKTITLSGPAIETLAPLLNGTRSLAEIVAAASSVLSPGQVGLTLGRLAVANLIGYRGPAGACDGAGDDAAADAYWDMAGVDGDGQTGVVQVLALGRVDTRAAEAACRACGLTVRHHGDEPAAMSIVLCDDYLDPALEEINADHLAGGRPWLLARPGRADPWVGPVFRPGSGACWLCLAERLRIHRRTEAIIRRSLRARGPVGAPDASLSAGRTAGLHIAVLEAAKWLAGFRYDGQREIRVLDTLDLSTERHAVQRRPQCAACGDPGMVAAAVRRRVVLNSRPKAHLGATGHRARSPEQVLERYGHLVDPVTGVVPGLRRDARGPSFLHSYVSGPNVAALGDSLSAVRAGLRCQSGGKGVTDIEARASALCEAVERYCGARFGDEPVVRDSLRGLGEIAVHPDTWLLFHERQLRDRERWNAICGPFHWVPEPFDERAAIEWTPVWSLVEDRQRLLPTTLLYFETEPVDRGWQARADSNGNAAGASLEDAILQGFLELVERDAVALWWYNRTRQPEVALDSFDDPWIAELTAAYAGLHRRLWVIDLTTDLGIPAMAAISRRTDKPAEDIMLGFGAHFDPHVAVCRALTELGQLLPAVAGVRADGSGYGQAGADLLRWWTRATVADQPYLLPGPGRPHRRAGDYDYRPRAELRADIDHVRDLARRHDFDLLVLDQTRPDIGLPVAKVICPGLRHFWRRLAPGRLYDVPVRLGRLPAPTEYDDLNPIPLFL
ncbi:MAG TPA: TOMM precursor leader peptide-binding protein [Streptosporangiaceae bacterium]